MNETLLLFSPRHSGWTQRNATHLSKARLLLGKDGEVFFLLEFFQLLNPHPPGMESPPILYVPMVRKPRQGWTKAQPEASPHGFPSTADYRGPGKRGQKRQGTVQRGHSSHHPRRTNLSLFIFVLQFQHRALNRRGGNPSYLSLEICEPETPSSGGL